MAAEPAAAASARQRSAADGALVAVIVLYPWLRIWQGLDLSDFGNRLASGWLWMHHPGSSDGLHLLWLSNALTGILLEATPWLGAMAIRVAYVAVIYASATLAYRWLRASVERPTPLLAAIATTVLVASKGTGQWLNYNNLAGVFVLGMLVLWSRAAVDQRPGAAWGAGGLGALATYARISSATFAATALVPFVARRWRRQALRPGAMQLLQFAAGGIATALAISGVQLALGQFDDMWRAIGGLGGRVQGTSHAPGYMLVHLAGQHAAGLAWGLPWLAGTIVAGTLAARVHRPLLSWLLAGLAALPAAAIMLPADRWRWVIPGVCTWIFAAALVRLRDERGLRLRVAALLGLLALLLFPFGSNVGLRRALHVYWAAIPAAAMVAWHFRTVASGARQRTLHWAWIVAMLALATHGVAQGWRFSYRDAGDRTAMTAAVDHPKLRLLHTTPERAAAVGALLRALEQRVDPGDWLLALGDMPLLHYVTETRPYAGRPWPDNLAPETLATRLDERWAQDHELPVVVVSRYRVALSTTWPHAGRSWPSELRPYRDSEMGRRHTEVVGAFLRSHRYELAWHDRQFEIWAPPSTNASSQSSNDTSSQSLP